ncbi:MAG: hypothetical protein ACRD1I_06685 [Terriglobia bacterium]
MKPTFRTFSAALCVALFCVLGSGQLSASEKTPDAYTIQLPPQPNYSGFEWLVGDWTGKTIGKGPQGEVLLSVAYELGKRFMIFREEVSLPATKAAPSSHESLMGILSVNAGGGFEMNLYSSSGFVSHYFVTARHGEIDFLPDGGSLPPPGWLFRRVFRHTNPEQCVESVAVAPPQQAFFNYYTANLSRVTPATAASAASNSQPKQKKNETSEISERNEKSDER